MNRKGILALFGVFAALMMVTSAQGATVLAYLYALPDTTQSVAEGETVVYELHLYNGRDRPQDFFVWGYTPRYFGDPGFTHHFEYHNQVFMGDTIKVPPGREVVFTMHVTAYDSPYEVPEYWIQVITEGDLDVLFLDTYTVRVGPVA